MEGPSGLLIAIGLAGSYSLLAATPGLMGRIGLGLALPALVGPSMATSAMRAPVPRLLAPILDLGLLLLAEGARRARSLPGLGWSLLHALAATQLFAFAWAVAVRPDLIDRIDGYRIHGVVPSVLYGALWVAFGTCQLAWRRGASDAHAPLLAQP